jgi:hypothetical protein
VRGGRDSRLLDWLLCRREESVNNIRPFVRVAQRTGSAVLFEARLTTVSTVNHGARMRALVGAHRGRVRQLIADLLPVR